jgi:hypothetical protein
VQPRPVSVYHAPPPRLAPGAHPRDCEPPLRSSLPPSSPRVIVTRLLSTPCPPPRSTYPKDYKPADEGPGEYQTIPLDKIEDFGVHAKSYYPLDVTFFKSSTDR